MSSVQQQKDVLIVGGGHAGAAVAMALRQSKFTGSVAIVGAEPEYPYERPPLSKEYLSGEKSFERLLIRPQTFWSERQIDLELGQRVVTVEPDQHRVVTETGATFSYGHLIWATGGSPRRLTCSGHDLAGVHTVRTRADVDRMMDELPSVKRVVVVGGGYIGLEAAAVLAKLGREVVVIEAADRVLARVAGEPLSRFFENEHRAHGVEIHLGVTAACIEERDGRVCAVRLADEKRVPCEMVIVGVGIEPMVGPLLAAGAAGSNGVDVDEQCRSTLPDVFAIGDCATHCNKYANGSRIRLESVQNASDQASVVARTITGQLAAYDAVPWFWSNQYDLKLQTVGISSGHDHVVVRGDPLSRSFSLIYRRKGQVIALDCVNATRDYVQGRKMVIEGSRADQDLLARQDLPLKDLPSQ